METTRYAYRPPMRVRRKASQPVSVTTRLGDQLQSTRLSLGIKQADLASRAGLRPSQISDIECGRHSPTVETLARYCCGLGLTSIAIDLTQ